MMKNPFRDPGKNDVNYDIILKKKMRMLIGEN